MSSPELTLAKRFRTLANDMANRPVVARRGTLPSLLKFLQHHEWEVRHEAAHTILLLAQHPDNPEFLCREPAFIKTVYEAYKAAEMEDPELHGIFQKIFNELRHVLAQSEETTHVLDEENENAVDHMASARVAKNRGTRVRQGAALSRSLVIKIENLSAATHDELEHLLQTIRGIISYTVDAPLKTVRMFVSTQTSVLVMVLSDGGFEVSVVSDEVVQRSTPDTMSESGYAPSYRSMAGATKQPSGSFSDFRRTLVLHGLESNSLQARVAKQKEEQQRKYQQERGTISGLLGKLKSWW